jgi:hypothetical protein
VPTGSVDGHEIVGVNGERTFHEAIVRFVLDAVEFDQRVADMEAVLDQGQQFRARASVSPEWPLVKAAIIAGAAFPVATAVGDLYEAAARSIE